MDQAKFIHDLNILVNQSQNSAVHRFSPDQIELRPILEDDTGRTGFDQHYIYHTAWAMRELSKLSPAQHVDFGSSLRLENFQCSALDLICLHDYTMNGDYSRGKFQEAIRLAQQHGKRIIVEEFGGLGDTQMAQALNIIGATAHQQGLPFSRRASGVRSGPFFRLRDFRRG